MPSDDARVARNRVFAEKTPYSRRKGKKPGFFGVWCVGKVGHGNAVSLLQNNRSTGEGSGRSHSMRDVTIARLIFGKRHRFVS
jgi:hypothetical protein